MLRLYEIWPCVFKLNEIEKYSLKVVVLEYQLQILVADREREVCLVTIKRHDLLLGEVIILSEECPFDCFSHLLAIVVCPYSLKLNL